MNWALLWQVVLVASLLMFAVMAVITAIGGAFDVCKLFRRLRDEESDDSK